MAKSPETHVVDIPSDQTPDQHSLIAVQNHPLTEISESPGHLLLLKLYQLQEHRLALKISHRETHLDALKRDAFFLSALFFAFHFLFFTLTFTSTLNEEAHSCKNWWVPCSCSLLTSLVLVSWVQIKVCSYWRTLKGLNRDRSDVRAIVRSVQELRMKGSSFVLSKEAMGGTAKMKSSSVKIEWRVVRLVKENLVGVCLLGFTGLAVSATKFVLCSG